MTHASLSRVGAPVVDAHLPLAGTPAARFHHWAGSHRHCLARQLAHLTGRWLLIASFLEVNFLHPEVGPAGALTITSPRVDASHLRRRAERLKVIPFRELAEYIPVWEAGETVIAFVGDMADDLARRYETTPIRWSLNVPIRVEGTWVGLLGAVADERGLPDRAVAQFEALAEAVMAEFAAALAWDEFHRSTRSGNRFLRLLP